MQFLSKIYFKRLKELAPGHRLKGLLGDHYSRHLYLKTNATIAKHKPQVTTLDKMRATL